MNTETDGALPTQVLRAKAAEVYTNQSRETREQERVLAHLPLVRHIVQKIIGHTGRQADIDDLISAGTRGLVKASRAFDPTKHVEFSTYAYIRIRGAVIDELRGRSFTSPDTNPLYCYLTWMSHTYLGNQKAQSLNSLFFSSGGYPRMWATDPSNGVYVGTDYIYSVFMYDTTGIA